MTFFKTLTYVCNQDTPAELNIRLMTMKEMIANLKSSKFFRKFLLPKRFAALNKQFPLWKKNLARFVIETKQKLFKIVFYQSCSLCGISKEHENNTNASTADYEKLQINVFCIQIKFLSPIWAFG